MRKTVTQGDVTVRAVAGTYVVLLAMEVTPAAAKGLLGWAITRQGPDDPHPRPLAGTKVFRSVLAEPEVGKRHPSTEHPIQTLIWSDQGARPGAAYHYAIRPMYGTPGHLEAGDALEIEVATEDPDQGTHGVWFNRGAVASQGYSEIFGNRAPEHPDDPADPAVRYLTRGLLDAALAFIGRAAAGDRLHVAAYEFTYAPILRALRAAAERGVVVAVVHEDGPQPPAAPTEATIENRDAIATHLSGVIPNLTLTPRRRRDGIPHNKFIVWVQGGKAREVWTGSTNFTPSGFMGQTNVGHVVRDERIASSFLEYWEQLHGDPEPRDLKRWSKAATPDATLTDRLEAERIVPYFSPRTNDGMLDWYAARIPEAQETVMFTAAFGVSARLRPALGAADDSLRFLLLEKPLTQAERADLTGTPNVVTAAGAILGVKRVVDRETQKISFVPLHDLELDRWFLREDLFRHEGHVFFIHTKFLLVDPLSDQPLICTGSANFSTSSLVRNDENMLLIRGDTRVADIYLTEFDRLLRQFHVREAMNERLKKHLPVEGAKFLAEDDSWLDGERDPAGFPAKRRRIFFP